MQDDKRGLDQPVRDNKRTMLEVGVCSGKFAMILFW